jgi:Peptidase family M1 domain/Peptidase M1 N-terminal domain/Immune inhibitor A peptidase M6
MFWQGAIRVIRNSWLGLSVVLGAVLVAGVAAAGAQGASQRFQPGAPGIGDPYFPLDGNGGYDVKHYLLNIKYDPATDVLRGVATIRARATQNLSRFNLDFVGLTVRSIKVNGRPATWSRDGGELTVTPRRGLRSKRIFITRVRYDGVPEPIEEGLGISGFVHTDDGAVIIGEPHVAATWFPVNDHPIDKAAYTFRVTVPAGLEAVANGRLQGTRTKGGSTTWRWNAREPMASYLATATMGEFDLDAYRSGRIRFWDAIDPDLLAPPAVPRTGEQFAISQKGEPAYKRLARTIAVPDGGATLSFWITRDTEPGWDFVFVEAHTAGQADWTTLQDENGHTSQDTGAVCPFWLELHPFLTNYQTATGDETCSPQGATGGEWWAASGASDGWEQWQVDLSAYAGSTVEVAITYASDESVQLAGAFVDDIVVSTGEGSTSFEEDGDTFDGWTVPGAPAGSPPNPNDWIAGTVADTPEPLGAAVQASFSRQPEIIDFLSGMFGRYPFSAAGGIVDDADIGFALENQTRPIYSWFFFLFPGLGDSVVVHELAHQWYGDSLAVARWQHIWLNEGFATYAEWLWAEREGLATVQEIFDDFYSIPAEDPFWSLTIGDPGPDALFDGAVYDRGAMTLHQLRLVVGDGDFFRILRRWATSRRGGNVTTPQFIRLAERVFGQQLDALFNAWLFTPEKPALFGPGALRSSATAQGEHDRPALRGVLRHLKGKRM